MNLRTESNLLSILTGIGSREIEHFKFLHHWHFFRLHDKMDSTYLKYGFSHFIIAGSFKVIMKEIIFVRHPLYLPSYGYFANLTVFIFTHFSPQLLFKIDCPLVTIVINTV